MNQKYNSLQIFVLGFTMVLASYLGFKLKPDDSGPSKSTAFNIQQAVPLSFNDWQIDESVVPVKIDPQVQANLDKTYDQVLSRTYKNSHGDRVMLSIAYGSKQSKALQVHKPETCYTAQGFLIKSATNFDYKFQNYDIKARKIIAINGTRIEPIIYWIRFGDSTAYGGIEQTIKRVQLGLKGIVADGLLFRVSSVDDNVDIGYEKQTVFFNELLNAIDSDQRLFFIGLPH